MSLSEDFMLNDDLHPIDVVESLAARHAWEFDRVTDDHQFAQIIGTASLRKLAEAYGGLEHFQLPKAEKALLAVRNARIAADYQTSKTARQLAAEYRLTERQIVRILSDQGVTAPADRRQTALF